MKCNFRMTENEKDRERSVYSARDRRVIPTKMLSRVSFRGPEAATDIKYAGEPGQFALMRFARPGLFARVLQKLNAPANNDNERSSRQIASTGLFLSFFSYRVSRERESLVNRCLHGRS